MPKKHTQSNKTRKRVYKDLDEIHKDMKPEKRSKLLNQPIDLDLPGDGQHYCVECSRHFNDAMILLRHVKGKVHKQQLQRLKESPYTQAEADAAGGIGTC